jgi:hypothetical protein
LLGYRPGEPGDDKIPCVENVITSADPHTEHNTNYKSDRKFVFGAFMQFKFKTGFKLYWN